VICLRHELLRRTRARDVTRNAHRRNVCDILVGKTAEKKAWRSASVIGLSWTVLQYSTSSRVHFVQASCSVKEKFLATWESAFERSPVYRVEREICSLSRCSINWLRTGTTSEFSLRFLCLR
jgi:hypothetical protein